MFPNQQQMPRQGKSPLNEGLALLIEQQRINEALKKLAQMGQVSPVGPDGKPTIAGQAMQPQGGPPGMGGPGMPPQGGPQGPGMPPQGGPQGPQGGPPGMQDVMQQAAIGAQMQMAQMQGGGGGMPPQGPPPGMPPQGPPSPMDQGIASVSGDVQMAEGGIVGYAGDESSWVQGFPAESGIRVIRDWINRGRPSLEKPLIDSLIANLQSSGAPEEAETLSAYKDSSRQADVYRPPIAAPAPAPAQTEDLAKQQASDVAAQKARLAAFNLPNIKLPPMPAAIDTNVAGPDYAKADAAFQQGRNILGQIRTEPATGAEATERMAETDKARRAVLQAQGIDPDYLINAQKAAAERAERQRLKDESKLSGLREEMPMQSLISFLTGARGRSTGEVFSTGTAASEVTRGEYNKRIGTIEELMVQREEAAVRERNALAKMQYDNAIGDFKSAMAERNAAIAAQNDKLKLDSQLEMKYAEIQSGRELEAHKGRLTSKQMEVQQRGQDVTGRGEVTRALIEMAKERARLSIERMREEARGDPRIDRMLSALNQDAGYRAIAKRMETALTAEAAQSALRDLLAYQESQRKLFGLPAIPTASKPTYTYNPNTGLQPGR